MKFKFALKAGCAALALVAGGAAFATPFYLDVGANFPGGGAEACASGNCTGVKNQFTFSYDSRSFITDTNGNGIGAGDTIHTVAGVGIGGVKPDASNPGSFVPAGLPENNAITNFLPVANALSGNNGYGTYWNITLKATLDGTVTGLGGPGGNVPLLNYTSGLIDLYLNFYDANLNVTSTINFMDILVSGGGSSGNGTVLFGTPDFTTVDASAYKNLFHSTGATCGGSSGFYDIWLNCPGSQIAFSSSQDTDVTLSSFTYDASLGQYVVTSDHDGSGKFDVPEPGSLALLGLGLAGLGLTQRRRKVAAK